VGEDPAYVMQQIGHSDPGFTLRLYTHAMRRQDGERERLRALLGGPQSGPFASEPVLLSVSETGLIGH
jgi:hypothetical protein